MICLFFVFLLHIYLPITRKRSMRYTSSLRSYQPPVYPIKMGKLRQVPFPAAQVNLPTCSPHCLFHAERQAGKL